jgi:hypothetical protein
VTIGRGLKSLCWREVVLGFGCGEKVRVGWGDLAGNGGDRPVRESERVIGWEKVGQPQGEYRGEEKGKVWKEWIMH